MQTSLAPFIRDTPEGREADAILRKCTHCGMCTATCPTYQLLNDELDGPRGRIYLIKQVLEGATPTARTQLHLDRCLTCRACETTCPTGVRYGRLVDIGRHLVEERVSRGLVASTWRGALDSVISSASLFGPMLKFGQLARPLLPSALKRKVPPAAAPAGAWPATVHARRMLVLEGCVQPSLSPATNAAAARVLDRIGISLLRVPAAGCCGGVSFHLNRQDKALDTYYLSFALIVSLRWEALAKWTSVVLFACRFAGVILFEVTQTRVFLLIFPNLFENFYLAYLIIRKLAPSWTLTPLRLSALLVLLLIPKLAQEYLLHYQEAKSWDWIKTHILRDAWRF